MLESRAAQRRAQRGTTCCSFQAPSPSTYDADVAELVSRSHGVVVEQAGRCHPAGVRIIRKDDELVLVPAISNPEETLLDVGDDDPLADGVDTRHQVGNVLQRREGRVEYQAEK